MQLNPSWLCGLERANDRYLCGFGFEVPALIFRGAPQWWIKADVCDRVPIYQVAEIFCNDCSVCAKEWNRACNREILDMAQVSLAEGTLA